MKHVKRESEKGILLKRNGSILLTYVHRGVAAIGGNDRKMKNKEQEEEKDRTKGTIRGRRRRRRKRRKGEQRERK